MKKLLLFLLLSIGLNAQFNYQAIVKDSNGNVLTDSQVKFKFTLMEVTSTSTPVYVEEHTITTPQSGVVNLSIGAGDVSSGSFSGINWSNAVYVKEELDTGSGYEDVGTRQFASVPVAEYAKNTRGIGFQNQALFIDELIASSVSITTLSVSNTIEVGNGIISGGTVTATSFAGYGSSLLWSQGSTQTLSEKIQELSLSSVSSSSSVSFTSEYFFGEYTETNDLPYYGWGGPSAPALNAFFKFNVTRGNLLQDEDGLFTLKANSIYVIEADLVFSNEGDMEVGWYDYTNSERISNISKYARLNSSTGTSGQPIVSGIIHTNSEVQIGLKVIYRNNNDIPKVLEKGSYAKIFNVGGVSGNNSNNSITQSSTTLRIGNSSTTLVETSGKVSATSFKGNADEVTLTYSGTVTNVLAVISDLQRQIAELKELVNAGICLPKLSYQIDNYTLTEGVQAQNGVIYGMIDFCPQNNSGTASVTITGTVPSGLSFNWGDTMGEYKLVGTPAVGTAGTYSLTVVALIGSTTLTDNFNLTITPAIYLANNGVTIKCENASVGVTSTINNKVYTVVSEAGLRAMVANDEDVTCVCTSLVTDTSELFLNKGSFNQDIGSWDTSNVTNMYGMFADAVNFNQSLNYWDVSNVTTMELMFVRASSFNSEIGNWNIASLTSLKDLFLSASSFNQDISSWNTSNITNMYGVFNKARAFNQDISSWDTSNVTNMRYLFQEAEQFNQDISGWDTSNVTDMRETFNYALSFDQDLSGWCVTNITALPQAFDDNSPMKLDWTNKRPVWGTCPP